jgi:autotransporter-associated beta strand protein
MRDALFQLETTLEIIKSMKTLETLKHGISPSIDASNGSRITYSVKKKSALFFSVMAAVSIAQAADISWNGGTADYTNAASWVGGIVPGPSDTAINDSGSNNVVRVRVGNPDWAVNQIRAGNGAGDGSFTQDGQTITLSGTNAGTGFNTSLRLGLAAGDSGIYTLNGGTINYTNGSFNVGELGTGILNINGGAINGRGNFAVNLGAAGTPVAVNATVGGGLSEGDFTWFEQGANTANPSSGLPAAGSPITSFAQPDHSYNLPPSYTANNAVLLASNVVTATITPQSSVLCSGLSFLLTSGNGSSTLNYTVHHADAVTETGSLTVPDWFGPGTAQEVLAVGSRVDALGVNFQFPGPANGFTGNAPYLWSLDIPVTDTTSPVTSIDVTFVGGGVATILGVSAQATPGGAFSPIAITGFNKDVIIEAGAAIKVSGSVTDIVTQVNGSLNLNGELWVGNGGAGVYNLSGGTINSSNWIVTGRSGGNGTFNMTGGTINKTGNGNIVTSARSGSQSAGTFNQSGGTINSSSELWIGQGDNNAAGSIGTNNISGTAVLNVSNWLAVGREGGVGVLNISGGSVTKSGNGNVTITHGNGASGTVNQSGGSITVNSGEVWIGEDSATGTWNMNGGTANLGVVHIVQNASASGVLNLNGGVMTLQVLTTGNGAGVSLLNFNGGTLQAATNNPGFVSGLFQALVGPGGAIIDSQGFSIGIPQELDDNGGGGLTKNGVGTLTLTAANTYTGPTIVNAGTLIVGTSATGGGSYTIADNAGFGTIVQTAGGQLNVASLSMSGSVASTLSFDLGNFGNPGAAPLNVVGALTASGNITVNIADGVPQVGQFPLIKYGSLSGAPNFTLGTRPNGVAATLVNNTANNSIDLNITGVNLPRWDGEAGGNWDIGLTTNWVNIGTSLPTFYSDGNAVLMNDLALGTTTVNLTTTVKPVSVTVDNSTLPYTIAGSGKISGATGLTKIGTGSLSILNTGGNDYTGPTVITNGTLIVTNLANGGSPSPIGASSASPTNLVLNNATFTYSGAPVTANRGFSIANTNVVIDAESDFTLGGLVTVGALGNFIKTGPGQFGITTVGINQFASGFNPGIQVKQGTLLMDGSAGPQTNHTVNEMWVGGTPASGGSLILSNTTLNVDSWFAVGRGNGTIGNTSSATLYNSRLEVGNVSLGYWNNIAGNFAFQSLTLNGSSVLTNHGDMNLCESAGSTATISINGTSVLAGPNRFFLPNGGGATGTVAIANSGQLIVGNAWFSLGNGDAGTGSATVKDNGRIFVAGDFNITDTGLSVGSLSMQDNATASGNAVYIGKSGGSVAHVTMSGGTLVARGGDLQMGASGNATFNQTGGTVIGTNWISIGRNGGGVGVYNLSGGTLMKVTPVANRLNVAENGTGTLNVSGTGTVIVGVGGFADLDICSGNGNGTINLNGGSISAGRVTHLGSGTATFNFNGGTLIASVTTNSLFMSGLSAANVMANGALIDSGTNVIDITQPLLDGTGGGGLTKLGNGTLRLDGVNTYTGSTLVSAGGLGGTGTIAGPVGVAAGARLAPGGSSTGTLTINNSLTFSNASSALFRISNAGAVTNNDRVTGLTAVTYNGSLVATNSGGSPLVVGSVFKLFNAAAPGTGNFSSVSILPGGTGTFNPATGELTVTSTGTLTINKPFVSGGNLVVTGTGDAGSAYTLLSSTNLLLPLAQWETNATGTFSGAGTSSNAIPITSTNRYFLLRQP